MKNSPALKGLITAIVMIGLFLTLFYTGKNSDSNLHYLAYLIYGLGIFWAVMAYRMSGAFTGRFGDIFNQGFRCFIVVTLVLVAFYGIFNYLHPEFAEESAIAYRDQLTQAQQTLPNDIESAVATYKKQYTLKLVSGAIFGYLIIGAGVTAVLSAFIMRRK